ncbi:hypothetical protein ACME73_000654, partial [Campylobacter jejuni]
FKNERFKMNLLQCEICQITRSFLNTEVAYNYAVDNTTIMSHKNLHSDELIKIYTISTILSKPKAEGKE